MMKIIDNVELVDREQWKNLLKYSATRNFFQSLEWYEFCCRQPSFEAFIYVLVNDSNVIRGIIVGHIQKDGGRIKRFLSRRAIIHGGPLFTDDILDKEVDTLLKAVIRGLRKKAIYIECRNFNDYSKYKNVFKKNGFDYIPHLNFHIDTTSIECIQKNLHRNKKRQIKSSKNAGVIIDMNSSINDIALFYSLLKRMYQTKVKTPLPDFSYFEDLYNQTYSKYFIVKKENDVIGGLVVLTLENDTVYQLYLCGLDGQIPGIYPSVMATYAGIQYAAEHNCHKCDLMGAGKPDKDYGVRDFKAGFGGELVEHGRFCRINNIFLYQIGRLGVKFLKSFC